jgi:hypothetical protein
MLINVPALPPRKIAARITPIPPMRPIKVATSTDISLATGDIGPVVCKKT